MGFEISWTGSGEDDNKGYRLYGKSATDEWQLLLNETILTTGITKTIVNPPENDSNWLFTVRAVGLGPQSIESEDPDIYGASSLAGQKILVVDAFDRTTGQWSD